MNSFLTESEFQSCFDVILQMNVFHRMKTLKFLNSVFSFPFAKLSRLIGTPVNANSYKAELVLSKNDTWRPIDIKTNSLVNCNSNQFYFVGQTFSSLKTYLTDYSDANIANFNLLWREKEDNIFVRN